MSFETLDQDEQVARLGRLAGIAIAEWDLPAPRIALLEYREWARQHSPLRAGAGAQCCERRRQAIDDQQDAERLDPDRQHAIRRHVGDQQGADQHPQRADRRNQRPLAPNRTRADQQQSEADHSRV